MSATIGRRFREALTPGPRRFRFAAVTLDEQHRLPGAEVGRPVADGDRLRGADHERPQVGVGVAVQSVVIPPSSATTPSRNASTSPSGRSSASLTATPAVVWRMDTVAAPVASSGSAATRSVLSRTYVRRSVSTVNALISLRARRRYDA